MERIARALEFAASARNTAKLTPIALAAPPVVQAVPDIAPVMLRPEPQAASETTSAGSPRIDEPTATHRAPIVVLDPNHLAAHHILPPNAGGKQGATYKLLRTQVLARLDQLGANTLAVLSPTPACGNTLTAINLAIAISADLSRTALLVDLNLRDPMVSERMGFKPELGIEQCLRGTRPVEDVLLRVADYERLAILPAKEAVEHSSELLSSERSALLMSELRSRYKNRIMVFDLPPVLSADDALAFSRVVQAGLLVIADETTQREELRRCVTLLEDMPLLGTVLNRSPSAIKSLY